MSDDFARGAQVIDDIALDKCLQRSLDEHPDRLARLALADDDRIRLERLDLPGPDQFSERSFRNPGKVRIAFQERDEIGFVHVRFFISFT